MKPMPKSHKHCLIITEANLETAKEQIQQADILEFRLDLFKNLDFNQLKNLRQAVSLPVIFTLRHVSHGGNYHGQGYERLENLRKIAALQPDYLDMESDIPKSFFEEMQKVYPKIKLICSHHNLKNTPEDLALLIKKMVDHPAQIYKLATLAHTSIDVLRMLKCIKETTEAGYQFIGICLGLIGQPTRILGPIFGNAFTYATLNNTCTTAPGQIDLDVFLNVYFQHSMNKKTRIFGLIGDPVHYSPSHIIHNASLQAHHENAVYVKFNVKAEEIQEFLFQAHSLGIAGLSVTMPLKEEINNYCIKNDPTVTSINTLVMDSDVILGHNTDGAGALDTIQRQFSIHGKHIVLLGAGGVAKGIAHALSKYEIQLTVLNRTVDKAQMLAEQYGGNAGSLKQFSAVSRQGYDLLINCTCIGMGEDTECPIDIEDLLPDKYVMETIMHPKETSLVVAAKQKGCKIIYGSDMFHHQAARQFALWGITMQNVKN